MTRVINQTVSSISDDELLRRAVTNARAITRRKGEWHARWIAVQDTFVLGSNYARQLCARFNLDPEEQVKR